MAHPRRNARRLRVESLEDRAVPSTLYDEAVSGDLSNSQSAPTPVTVVAGTNSLFGTVGGTSGSQDWITVHVPAGMELDQLVLAAYSSTDAQGFIGVQAGTSFVGSPFTPGSYLGYAHFGTGATNGGQPATNLVGDDLLPIMGNTSLATGSHGFTPPLAAGDYTFLIQQQGAITTYQFDFDTSIVPASDLVVGLSHADPFLQGDAGDTYSITVTNNGTLATSGTVTVTGVLPAGLMPTPADTGTANGWALSVNGQTVKATRSGSLTAGNSYPPLIVTVDVAANATDLTNAVNVAGGGEVDTTNDGASDPTSIQPYTAADQPPVNTLPANYSTTEDTPVPLAGLSIADPDVGIGTEQVTLAVDSGSLTVSTSVAGGVTAAQVSGNGTSTVVLTARPAAVNATLAGSSGLVFAPGANQNGNVALTMTTDDQGNRGTGGPLTDQDTAAIAVAAVDDPPTIATDAGLTLDPGATAAIDSSKLAAADVDNTPDQLTFTVSNGPTHGQLLLSGTPTTTFTQADIDAGHLSYQHDGSAGNSDSFAFTVSDGTLSVGPATFDIVIQKSPVVTADPSPASAFAGELVTFTAAADGSPVPTVQWQQSTNGGTTFTDIPGATSASLTFKVDSTRDGDQYRAVFANRVGTIASAAAELTVVPGLVIQADPSSQAVPVGTKVTLAATATGATKVHVQWQVSTDGGVTFSNIRGAVRSSLRVTAAATVDGDRYRAVFTDAAGSAPTAAAGLTVDYSVTVSNMRRKLVVPVGASVSLTGSLPRLTSPAVQWEASSDHGKHYSPVTGATSATLSFTAAAADTGKLFRATFTENGRTRRTAPAALVVGTPPAVLTPPADASVTAGQTATFSIALDGTPPVHVQWQTSTDGGKTFTDIRGATKAMLTLKRVKAAAAGSLYRAVLTSPFGTAESSAARLTVT